jgi:hypothetical protein
MGTMAGSVLYCVLAGCSSTAPSSGRDGAADTTTTTGGMCGVGIPAGQECNGVKAMGAAITPACATGAMPAGSGGTILDGTYELTASTYYNSTSCEKLGISETVVFSGNCIELATGTPFPATVSGTFTVVGTQFMTTRNCLHIDVDGATTISNAPSGQTYSATPTSFTLFENNSANGSSNPDTVAVYTRR